MPVSWRMPAEEADFARTIESDVEICVPRGGTGDIVMHVLISTSSLSNYHITRHLRSRAQIPPAKGRLITACTSSRESWRDNSKALFLATFTCKIPHTRLTWPRLPSTRHPHYIGVEFPIVPSRSRRSMCFRPKSQSEPAAVFRANFIEF